MAEFPKKIIMIGCGNMAGAILDRWLACGLDPSHVTVVDPMRATVADGVTLLRELPALIPDSAVVTLGIKPQLLGQLAPQLASLLNDSHIVISMLAGVSVDLLQDALGNQPAIVRLMPNTPVALGQGVCALYVAPPVLDDVKRLAADLMEPLGLVEWISDQAQFNLVTALSGCGPAFLFRFIDALSQAAIALGMEQGQAERFALATVQGAASLAAAADVSPAQLAENVASPGGMTREGLDVLDADSRLNSLLLDTLRAAQDRGDVLAKMAQ
jgi:pyrroline-5-carboxylate reductase